MSEYNDPDQHYRRAQAYPVQDDTSAIAGPAPTGELPVWSAPKTTPPVAVAPHGPYLPSVIRGVVLLIVAAFVVVWRLSDNPDWAAVGIGFGIGAGVLFLVAAVASFAVQRARRERDFDRMLSGS